MGTPGVPHILQEIYATVLLTTVVTVPQIKQHKKYMIDNSVSIYKH